MEKLTQDVLQLPKEVYDSDGEGDENWKDDIDQLDFEEDENEGRVNYIEGKAEAEKQAEKFLKKQMGRSTLLARFLA